VFYLTAVNIPDELYGEIEKAVKNGACCSVNHWVYNPEIACLSNSNPIERNKSP